jgi:cyclopropane fatty-acyl-phospholipid synthase-like methyltransferase
LESAHGLPARSYLVANPEAGSVFNSAMVGFAGVVGTPCLDVYDFAPVQHLVDIGGGVGQLAREVARRHPHLRATIFDQPQVVAEAEEAVRADGLAERCRAEGGDFFTAVPAGDCYTLRWIIHDWNDAESVAILRACRAAIAPTGRLLLFEVVRPATDGPHLARTLDWIMLTGITGKERTVDEYAALLDAAGFRVERVIPSASPMSIIEAFPA